MGPQRILQAAGVVALALVATVAGAAPLANRQKTHERVAIVDLGPADGEVARRALASAVIAAGLEAVIGDGVEDALAGDNVDKDTVELAAALARAQAAFGRLDCKETALASAQVVGIAAQRQAASGQATPADPELARALALMLLCADREGDPDRALLAATRLRAIGATTTSDIPDDVWAKYPDIDVLAGRELVPLEITTDAPNATVWIDFRRAGTAPLTAQLPIGEHVIAVAGGTRRGWAAGAAVKTQTTVAVPTRELAGTWSEVAERVASWHGKLPSTQELGWVMAKVRARVAIVRRGDRAEVFGRIGLAEAPHRVGGDDGVAKVAEADRLAALIVDRVHTWNDRAPDPDRPLLTEDNTLGRDGRRHDPPTKWWVYASILGAVAAGAILIYAQDAGGERQRVELHQP